MCSIRVFVRAVVYMAILLGFCVHCSDDNPTTPTKSEVQMNGTLVFPGAVVAANEITVSFGSNVATVDTNRSFSIVGNAHIAGLAMASDQDGKVLLMQIVADPETDLKLNLDATSTAKALVFLHPFVCNCDHSDAEAILDRLDSLEQFVSLRDYLVSKIEADARTLSVSDPLLDALVSEVIRAYVESFPSQIHKLFPLIGCDKPGTAQTSLDSPPEIVPSTEKGGLLLTSEGGDRFRIQNSYCRWAYCTTPTDSFFIFPSGDFLDMIKSQGTPFPPSRRDFTHQLVAGGDTLRLNVYGYGFLMIDANRWHNLSMDERNLAHMAGAMTAIWELGRHTMSVVANVVVPAGSDRIADLVKNDIKLVSFVYTELANLQRLNAYVEANDPSGASYWIVKQFLSRIVNSDDYRQAFYAVSGVAISSQALQALGKWIAVPVKAALAFNSVTQGFRAVLGFNSSMFRTSFVAWKEYTDFGAVQGYVGDKQSGLGISGAVVQLLGDENNPMHPAHQQTTSNTGYFHFENIGVGEKSLQATKSGYKTVTVGIMVVKNQTIDQNIILEKQTGGLSGMVLNQILQYHGITPPYFADDAEIEAKQIGGNQQLLRTSSSSGAYTISLPVGNWWIVASHEDYKADSFQVSVQQAGNITAPRDLILVPDPSMTGTVYFDMDNNGNYESSNQLNFPQVGLRKPALFADQCDFGGSPLMTMLGTGVRGASNSDFDFVEIGLTSSLIEEAGNYPVGGIEYWGCSAFDVKCAVLFGTTLRLCRYEQTIDAPMVFSFYQDPDALGCNCGVTVPGDIFLTEWGTELGDVVAGAINLDLSGWKTCDCSGSDSNDDGTNDEWEVDCAKVRISIDFRFLVGTDYLIEFRPGQSKGNMTPLVN